MSRCFLLLLLLQAYSAFAQDSPTERARPIVEEGKRLYRCEMASWHGTDLFLAAFKDQSRIGGYVSYLQDQNAICVFFSTDKDPKVIGTITFDSTYDVENTRPDLAERRPTANELELFEMRRVANDAINSDTLFKGFSNTRLNIIPIISEGQKKVYVLTGPQNAGVVILGNDYLITFDKDNKITSKKQLHQNIIPIYYDNKEEVEGTIHSHLPETGEFITATDICTLMLYAKYAKWKQHSVVSKDYLNIWNCESNHLIVVPMGTSDKKEKNKKND